jgi:hypothetical protein
MNENAEIVIRGATNDDSERGPALVCGGPREYGSPLDPKGTDRDVTDIEARYISRGGAFELLEDEAGRLLGTVGLYPLTKETVELRKTYFSKALRGRGAGRRTPRPHDRKSARQGL